jgi:hypothetical protein
MRVRDKDTREVIDLGEGAYEVKDAFIVPLRCLYKKDYEIVKENKKWQIVKKILG